MTQNRNLSILADQVNSSGVLGTAGGGTGLSSTPANGQLDIGNGTGFTRATLTAGSNIAITNGAGSISIATTGLSSGFSNMQVYTSGTNTWTVPAGVTACKVTVVAGGGGGASAGGNYSFNPGAGGGAAIRYVTGLTPGGTVTATVGAGGTAGTSSNNGGTGGTSSFGAYCSATGGAGGVWNAFTSSSGGTGSGGSYNFTGQRGGVTGYVTTPCGTQVSVVGGGGNGFFGGGAPVANQQGGFPLSGLANSGGGGSGAQTGTAGAGGSGIIIIEY